MLTTDPETAPLEETRQLLFAVNLLEDMKQDAIVNWSVEMKTATKIFEMLPDVSGTADRIRQARDAP